MPSRLRRLVAIIHQTPPPQSLAIKPFFLLAFPIALKTYEIVARTAARDEAAKAAAALRGRTFLYAPHKGVVVAYVSPDLGDHPVGHNAWFHVHKRFKPLVISLANDGSAVAADIQRRAGSNFVDAKGASALQLAELINGLDVDVLVTITGTTAGNQLATLAMRPAPVQIAYMGSHDTTGLKQIDFLISDPIATPPEFAPFVVEKLALLPASFFVNEYRKSRGEARNLALDAASQRRLHRAAMGCRADVVMCNFNQVRGWLLGAYVSSAF
jgi:protein O-GlcNAc transferase